MRRMSKLVSICMVLVILFAGLTACGIKKSINDTFISEEAATGAVSGDGGYSLYNVEFSYDMLNEQMLYEFNTEEYNAISENNFKSVKDYPLSTFSVDVDTASYSNVRRMINNGERVVPDAVRIEEMINYFKYDYKKPAPDVPFSINTELSDCPWNKNA